MVNRLILATTHSLVSHGIKSYRVIRAIHDEIRTNNQRIKRSRIDENIHKILTLELDDK